MRFRGVRGGELARRVLGSYDPFRILDASQGPSTSRFTVFEVRSGAGSSFDASLRFSCAPRSERSGCDERSDLTVKSRNRDVASAGHHRERLKSSPRPARGKFPSGDVPPRGRPSVLPGAQGGASGWGLRVGPLGGLRGPARAQSPLGSHPRVFSGSICAARFSFDTAPKFSCAPRSEKSEVPPEPPRGPRAGGPEPFPSPPGRDRRGERLARSLHPPQGRGFAAGRGRLVRER